jgi:putative MATE family efflux protein
MTSIDTTPLDRKAIRAEVIRLAWPVVLQASFRTVLFVADTAMLGRFSNAALSAVGIVGPCMYTITNILAALSVGTIAACSRAFGEGNFDKVKRDGGTSVSLSLALGIAGAVAGFLIIPGFVSLFSVEYIAPTAGGGTWSYPQHDVTTEATLYLEIMMWFFPIMIVEMTASSILRAVGNTRAPMVAAGVGNLLNIVLNYLFIFGFSIGSWSLPALGMTGAALATGIAFTTQCTLALLYLNSSRCPVPFAFTSLLRWSSDSLRRLAKVSFPAAVEPLVLQSGFLSFTWIVTRLGDVSLAVHRAVIAVESMGFMPGYGFSIAAAAIVGQRLGAKKPEEAAAAFRESARLSLKVMTVIGLAFLLFPSLLMRLSTDDPGIIELGVTILMIGALEQPMLSLAMVFGGALRGAGDTKSPVIVAILGVWAVRVPCAWFLGVHLGWGLKGVWITTVIDWTVRSLVFWLIYRRGKWKEVTL